MSAPDNPNPEQQHSAEDPHELRDPLPPDSFVVNLPSQTPVGSVGPSPIENPVWNGWDVLFIACLAFVSMVVLQFVVLLAAKRFAYPRLSLGDIATKPIVLLAAQFLLYIPIAAFMVLLVEGKYHAPFWKAIRWNWPGAAWKLIGVGVLLLFGLSALQNLLPMPKDTPFEHLFDRPRDAYLLSLLAVTLGPLMEELFFRGFMYPVIARRIGIFWGIVLSALPFGLIHLPQYGWAWAAGFVIFLVGVVCGVVRAVTKSVGCSFLVHTGYNAAQMVIALVATQGFRHM